MASCILDFSFSSVGCGQARAGNAPPLNTAFKQIVHPPQSKIMPVEGEVKESGLSGYARCVQPSGKGHSMGHCSWAVQC